MSIGPIKLLILIMLTLPAQGFADEGSGAPVYIVKDGDVGLTYEELKFLTEGWTPQMIRSAIEDEGDRLELINLALANKKLSVAADDLVEQNPELALEYRAGQLAYQRRFVLGKQRQLIEVPDFSRLAKEQYLLEKEKIAINPEKRLSSHILFAAAPGVPRDEVLVKAQSVLDELRDGANFEEMVREYSEEPGAAAKNGAYSYWMQFGDKQVSPPYSKGVFEIAEIGEYSELTQTQFGVHIIRLDGIREKTYRTFEELKPQLIEKMEVEYKSLAMKDYLSQFNITDDATIDDAAVMQILSPGGQAEK